MNVVVVVVLVVVSPLDELLLELMPFSLSNCLISEFMPSGRSFDPLLLFEFPSTLVVVLEVM